MLLRLKAPAEQASGKQGQQLVYFVWRNAQTAREWIAPSQPQTLDQVTIRAYLTTITKRWSTLTSNQRASWTTYAANNPVVNRVGATVRSTALGMYLRCNIWSQMRTAGATFVDTAPTVAGPSAVTAITVFDNAGDPNIAITTTHGYTSLSGLYLVARAQVSISPATNPQAAAIPLISGVSDNSITALVTSGTAATFTAARVAYADADDADVVCQILDAFGQISTPFKTKIAVT